MDELLGQAPPGTHRLGLGKIDRADRAERRVREAEVLFLV
jgi:hypothetical protein